MEAQMGERRPAEVFHPGEHLLDELSARGWTQTEFADIIGRPVRLVNEIINGRRGITPETAREFGAAFGTSAEFWMNLDTAYNLWRTNEDISPIAHRAKMRNLYPIRDMALRGWIKSSEDSRIVESQLLRFFEVSSLDEQPKFAIASATKRSNSESEGLNPVQVAWLYRVKHIANTMQVQPYSKISLKNALSQLMACRETPEEVSRVPQLLEKCGIRFVIVEALPSSKIDGVTFWLDADSPVIGMSLRFDRIDNFWFVLRHEIEHILNEDFKDAVIIDLDLENISTDTENVSTEEKIANSASADFCVRHIELTNFITQATPFFSRAKVLAFAQEQEVHPGLVVGQLQRHLQRYDLFRPMLVPIRNIITKVAITDGYGYNLPVEI